MKIAVIGAGCAGVMTALYILKENKECEIDLFDASMQPAKGIAYGCNFDKWLLNVPAATMGIWQDDDRHFLKWLNKKGIEAESYSFVPRQFYGDYILECLEDTLDSENKRFKLIKDCIIDISQSDGNWQLSGKKDSYQPYTKVILAIGNQSPDSLQSLFNIRSSNIILNPWDSEKLEQIKNSQSVFLLGSGLTAIDVAVKLNRQNPDCIFYMLSRSGALPLAHAQVPLVIPDIKNESFIFDAGLNKFFASARKLVDEKLAGDWRLFVDALRPYSNKIWKNLSEREQSRFIRHLRGRWERVRHRYAPEISKIVSGLLESGRLKLLSGRLAEVLQEGHLLKIKTLKGSEASYVSADVVINCIGFGSILKTQNQLINNLIAKNICKVNHLGWSFEVNSNHQIIGSEQKEHKNLFLIGSLCRGSVFESTAVREIRAQAGLIASQI